MEHIDALEAVRRLTLERDALANELDAVKDDFRVSLQTLDSIRAVTGLHNYGPHLAESLKAMKEDRDALAQQVTYLTLQAADRERLAEQVRLLHTEVGGQAADLRIIASERDTLAARVKRIQAHLNMLIKERDEAVLRANHAENALQAPVRRERPETGTEPTKDPNGAQRGCKVSLCACCKRPVLRAVFCDACESRAANRIEKELQKLDAFAEFMKKNNVTLLGAIPASTPETCKTCASCLFWRDNSTKGYENQGFCRRMPPVLDREYPEDMGKHPYTDGTAWCGEWQAK